MRENFELILRMNFFFCQFVKFKTHDRKPWRESKKYYVKIPRNPLISNDHLSDEKLLLSDHCYYPHFHFRHVDSKKSTLNRK